MSTSVADIRTIVRQAYADASFTARLIMLGRPSICPFHVLIDQVPEGLTSGLDIGCGSGLFVNALIARKRLGSALGIDVSERALANAQAASRRLAHEQQTEFQVHNVEEGLPDQRFDLVSMIDVMHHIPPDAQIEALRQAITRLSPGGTFIYKDMVKRPLWRALANRCHDLVLARQWIHYLPIDLVRSVAVDAGLTLVCQQRIDMLWYGHELLVFTAPTTSAESSAGV